MSKRVGKRSLLEVWDSLSITKTVEARNLKFEMHAEFTKSTQNFVQFTD